MGTVVGMTTGLAAGTGVVIGPGARICCSRRLGCRAFRGLNLERETRERDGAGVNDLPGGHLGS